MRANFKLNPNHLLKSNQVIIRNIVSKSRRCGQYQSNFGYVIVLLNFKCVLTYVDNYQIIILTSNDYLSASRFANPNTTEVMYSSCRQSTYEAVL